ncbi:MAG: DUF1499 domain-containing protein [Spirochaetes bacterium]|nr:DUF1499 domain-containing protein [Spirochaetota bacterium]
MVYKLSALLILPVLLISCSGTRPDNLGIRNGRLAPCPGTPNCVSTFEKDRRSGIEPLNYTGTRQKAKKKLLKAIYSFKHSQIITEKEGYIQAEFKTLLWGFVDDVEFYLPDNEKVIHFRSASRIGKFDFGVNRKRMEKIRELFNKF